jgi:hypothetical protein
LLSGGPMDALDVQPLPLAQKSVAIEITFHARNVGDLMRDCGVVVSKPCRATGEFGACLRAQRVWCRYVPTDACSEKVGGLVDSTGKQ